MRARVLITPKEGILDPQGTAVEASLRTLGFGARNVRIGRVVEIEVDAADAAHARAQLEQMCERLLANALIERYEILLEEPAWAS